MEEWHELLIMSVAQMNEAHLFFSKVIKKQEKVGFANNYKTLSSLLPTGNIAFPLTLELPVTPSIW